MRYLIIVSDPKSVKETFFSVIQILKQIPGKIIKLPFVSDLKCTIGQKGEKKRNTPIYFNINYRKESKLVPIIMGYCLLQFDALKFFLRVCLHGGVST